MGTCEHSQFSKPFRLPFHITNIRQNPEIFSRNHARNDHHPLKVSMPKVNGKSHHSCFSSDLLWFEHLLHITLASADSDI